jgi:hypothetical protein
MYFNNKHIRRFGVWALLISAIATLWYIGLEYFRGGTVDDSYILYRYAKNLADGHGFRWNIYGEKVQGFTSILWVIVLAAGKEMSGLRVHKIAPYIGLVCSTTTLIFTYISCRSILPDRYKGLALIAPVTLSLSPAFVRHSISGMETSLVYLFVSVSILFLSKMGARYKKHVFAILTVISGMVRPDLILIVSTMYILHKLLSEDEERRIYDISIYIGACTILGSMYLVWLNVYFGSPIPLPAYMKSALNRASSYISFILSWQLRFLEYASVLIVLSLLVYIFRRRANHIIDSIFLSCLIFFLYLFSVVPIMNFSYRYQSILLIILIVTAVYGIKNILTRMDGRYYSLKALAFSCFLPFVAIHSTGDFTLTRNNAERLHSQKAQREELASIIDYNSGITIADTEAGKLPFFSGVNHIDLLGLNTKFIAYNRYDQNFKKKFVKYINKKEPEIYMYSYPNPEYLVIMDTNLFHKYTPVCGLKFRAAILTKSNYFDELSSDFRSMGNNVNIGGDCKI